MSSVATGYFRPGTSWLHRRNPITKLFGLGWVLLAAFLLPSPFLAGLVVAVGMAAWSVGLLRPLLLSLRIPALLLASILVVNALFFPGAQDIVGRLGPVALSREGLTFGLLSAGRILVAFMASILFLFTTLADDLLEALVVRGASHRIAFVMLSAVQMVPRLQQRAAAILDAQQARGLATGGTLRHRVGALVPLVGPLLLGALIDVRERTFALEARGFGISARRTAYRVVPDPPVDRALRPLIVVAVAAVVVVAVAAPFR